MENYSNSHVTPLFNSFEQPSHMTGERFECMACLFVIR